MENRSGYRATRIFLWRTTRGISPIAISAIISIAILATGIVWRATRTTDATNPRPTANTSVNTYASSIGWEKTLVSAGYSLGSAENSLSTSTMQSDDLSQIGAGVFDKLIGSYISLKQKDTYTPEKGDAIANQIADTFSAQITFERFSESQTKSDSDTSYERMLTYRNDLRLAFVPLLQNTRPELETFNQYIETKNAVHLTTLVQTANNYRKAAIEVEKIVVPNDAVSKHVAVINSLLHFAATLEAMVKYADDPVATLALLRAYNTAEQDMSDSFGALVEYERNKHI